MLSQRGPDQAAPRPGQVRRGRLPGRQPCPRPERDRRPLVNDIIAELSVISDEQAAGLVADATHAHLIAKITATPYQAERRDMPVRKLARTAGFVAAVAMSVAAAIVAAALLINSAGPPRRLARPIVAEALSFTTFGGYIDVIVRDPLADAKRYNAEFKAHGLHIRLGLV